MTTHAPDIIESILEWDEPERLTLNKLTEPVPLLWAEQRTAVTSAA